MDSIEVSNQLTIGGAPPLGQDAIDKLQNQIIAPLQTIVVSNNGSDETGDGTYSKPYKTIDKAAENIKPQVPTIRISIIDDTGTIPYYINKPILAGDGNTRLVIQGNDWNSNVVQQKRIQLYVNQNKIFQYIQNEKTYNLHGYFLASGWDKIETIGIQVNQTNIPAPNSPYDMNTDEYNRWLFACNDLKLRYSLIKLKNNSLWKPGSVNSFMENDFSEVNQSTDFYIITAQYNYYVEEESSVVFLPRTFGQITAIVNTENGKFTGNVSKLLASNCYCIYKNF